MTNKIYTLKDTQNLSKNSEFLFLVIAISFGLLYALFQPLFFEPDSSYHFDKSMYLSNTVVDRTTVNFAGEDYQSQPIPFTTISNMMQQGVYYKNFFETELQLISKKNANSRISKNYGTKQDIHWYNDWMHIIPAIGVKLGYMINPTIASMVIVARLMNLLFFTLSMFFIIKFLKGYKLVFVAISITPTIIQNATSLSYDCYNYVVSSFLIMMLLNLAIEQQIYKKNSTVYCFKRLIIPCILVLYSKTNTKLLFLLVLLFLVHLIVQKYQIRLLNKRKIFYCSIIISISLLIFLYLHFDSTLLVLKKMFYTILEPYYTVLSTEIISGTTTAAVPYWFYGIQMTSLFLLYFAHSKEIVSRWFAYSCFLIFVLNFSAIMISYALNPAFSEMVITGPQGRYFTPFLLLLAPIATIFSRRVVIKLNKSLIRFVFVVSIFALIFNIGITSVKFYHLNLPADEFRSGISHYIFK